LERGIAAVPNSYLLGLALGMEYLQRGRAEDAISTYENALSANSDADLIANNLAATLLDYRTDEASYARAKELTRNFNGTRNPMYADTLGWALYRNREYASAVRYLEIAVAGAGQDPLHRYHLGMAYVAAGDLVGARIELEKALELAGDNDFPGITEARAALDGLEK
jgi:Flp pilus assembly protein TadD